MHVTAIEPSGRLYGSEFCLLDVMQGTSDHGVTWDVAMPAGQGFDGVLDRVGIPYRDLLPPQIHQLPRWRKLASYRALRSHLRRQRPDVVYLNQAGMLRAVDVVMKGLGIPLVCQVQTLEDAAFIARHPNAQRAVTTFITNSRFTASHATVDPKRLSVLYQAVEPHPLSARAEPPSPGEPWRVGILGRIAVSKGHYVLIDAVRHLREAGCDDIEIVVIGEGLEPEDTAAYRRAVQEAGRSDVFAFRGYRRDVAAELARLQLLVIPSLAEPLGRVLLDACAAGLPAVVSDSGGLGEFSRAHEIGYRVPASDPEALAAGVRRILADYASSVTQARAQAKRLFRRLSPEAYHHALATILRRAANREPTALEWFGTEE